MSEPITVMSKTDLITSASGREYFTLTDETDRKLLCFMSALYPHLPVGGSVDIEVQAGKLESDTPRLTNVYVNGKPVVEVDKSKGAGRSYGKSDKELLQQKQLEGAKQCSIQAQTALIQAVNLAVAGKTERQGEFDLRPIMIVAREFYQLLQSLTQISEGEVILKGAKDVKTAKELPVEEVLPGHTRVDDTGGDGAPEWADWLRENIKKTDWSNKQWLTFLVETFTIDPVGVTTLSQAVEKLTLGQRGLFFNEIKSRLKED